VNGRRSGGGQAMVEFALVAPMFFILFIALADMSRGLFGYIELSMGSRAAARQAVLQYNASSDNPSSAPCSSPCQVPGVVPVIKQVAGFGYPIKYADSSSTTTPPSYATLTNDPGWSQNGSSPPYDISLTSSTSTNAIYVVVYEYDPTQASRNARWPVSGSARDSGHQLAVVDLKLKWTSITLSLLGLSPSLTLDAQTVQRIEY
jgi:hypothetical protein